jgi:hypothetical protein
MTVAERVQGMSRDELINAANGKGGASGYDDRLASVEEWAKVATEELKRRGLSLPVGHTDSAAPSDPISADAHFIAMSASRDAARIVKNLWIIFVLLPFVVGVVLWVLTQK